MKVIFLSICGLLVVLTAFAHGGGLLFEKTIGNYRTDIDYSSDVITTGRPGRFNFNIIETTTENFAVFTSVFVNIQQPNGEILFSGFLAKPEFGLPGITVDFPEPGDYKLTARFNNGNESLIETDFPLRVEQGNETGKSWLKENFKLVYASLGALIAGFLAGRIRKTKSDQAK